MKDQIGFEVESKLDIIMSSPKTSSNPQDYINAHQNEYEYFFKYGGEDALQYMPDQFEVGNVEGLRGQIMMQLCKELLGARNNIIISGRYNRKQNNQIGTKRYRRYQ